MYIYMYMHVGGRIDAHTYTLQVADDDGAPKWSNIASPVELRCPCLQGKSKDLGRHVQKWGGGSPEATFIT